MVRNKYHDLTAARQSKFKSIIDALGFGGRVKLAGIAPISAKAITASMSDRARWSDAKTRSFENALGVPEGFLDDGIKVSAPEFPILDAAGLRSWLCGSMAPTLRDLSAIPLLRIADVMRLLSGDAVQHRQIARDASLPQRARLVAVVCGEDCPSPLEAGDIAIFDLDAEPGAGLLVMAYVPRHGCLIRRYRERQSTKGHRYELTSADADYPNFKINAPEDAQLLGVLVQLRRTFVLT